MSGYVRQVTYKETFDGDAVEVVMRPLTQQDAMGLRGGDAEGMADKLRALVGNYVVELRGLRAADGTEVTKEELATNAYFLPLALNAAMELVKKASVQNPGMPAS